MSKELVQGENVVRLPVAQSDSSAIMNIIDRMSREPNFNIESVQQLLALKREWDANEARKAFVAAMAAFKANPPKIVKNKHVRFQTEKGVTEYDHATHSEVTEKIAAALGAHGLSHRWNVEQSEGRIRVTCIITHSMGHSEQVALTASADDSGRKNSIQAIGSAITYLQRYTLLSATGLTTADMDKADNDGATAETPATISAEQIAILQALLAETKPEKRSPEDHLAKFLALIKADSLESILAASYDTVHSILASKRK